MATKKRVTQYQYEPPITPRHWSGDELNYAVRLSQTLDDIYNKYSALREALKEKGEGGGIVVETDPTVPAWAKKPNPPEAPVTSVNGKTGAVDLAAGDVNAAPTGYGLGADPTYVSDANACKSNGWFYIDNNTANKPAHINYAVLFVYRRNYAEYVQEVIDVTRGLKAIRSCYDGATWSEWGYENPSMELGVEYRTTERYNDKPVYTMLVSMGEWLAGSYVDTGINGYAIRHAGELSGSALPLFNGGEMTNDYSAYVTAMRRSNKILVYMYGGTSQNGNTSGRVQIWYYK